MELDDFRDTIVIKNIDGEEMECTVEALFEMEGKSYALLSDGKATVVMQVEEDRGEQYLVGIYSTEEKEAILDAYEIAMEAAMLDNQEIF
ncbi:MULTISPECIES: DUF1292 domain-containing protein [Sutcliffiella]|uniref:DUF1292 domain-containing protein n=1 Tax=Sutcliffiella cohnii TaxID=33932 RepID=A0A223KUB6_9BACI|nr:MULTISPECIES: DUF1292 domain-containing protein [Sutcliffiella]AST93066.1 hypothetical protein BC6307_18285 [Sutcliffiella cohnii]MED4016762.1 DUF1292 domain-containing protein [Sutcliffiella cohnii]WBL14269.1 DUF1292 domain-containing protein [Sutcliffiella sp. NC1]